MERRTANLTVSLGVADVGVFTASLPLIAGKQHARFASPGQSPLAGNHLYVENTEGVLLCGLRTNNGTLDRDVQTDNYFWRGVIRYTSYTLTAPPGAIIVMEDGTVGAEIKIYEGEPLDFLPRATFESRFAICRPALADLAKEKLTYADFEDHDWKPLADNFGPSELPLPSVDGMGYEEKSVAEYAACLTAWRNSVGMGPWELEAPRIGTRQPAGEVTPYAHGGNGIDPTFGYEQCRSSVLVHRWKHSRWMDRMNAAIYDAAGKQLDANSFPSPQQIAQIRGEGMWQFENELPVFLTGSYDTAQYPWVNAGASPRREEVWQYKSVWISHYIRAIKHGIAVWEYTHDPMIADDLIMLFEHMRLQKFSDRGDEVEHGNDGYTPPSIRAYIYDIKQWPNQGSPHFDRSFGWAMYLGAQLHRMGEYRGAWLRKMTIMHDLAMMTTGISSRDHQDYFPEPNIQGVQTFHEMIICIGFHAACTQMRRSAVDKLRRIGSSVLDNPNMPSIADTYSPDGAVKGPPHWIWTHIDDLPVPIKSENSNGAGDASHVSHVLALLYIATHEQRWLDVSLKHWHVAPDLTTKLAMLKGGQDKTWGGTLQAVLEALPQTT